MLNLFFVESSLELVPRKIARHPSVTRNAQREGKNPEGVLLDRSLHHHAMLSLPEAEKRGRPDIIHFCLLEALGSPLNKAVAMRERPTGDGAKGKFFQTSVGIDSSFPSNHSFLAWSSAAVLAVREKPRRATWRHVGGRTQTGRGGNAGIG